MNALRAHRSILLLALAIASGCADSRNEPNENLPSAGTGADGSLPVEAGPADSGPAADARRTPSTRFGACEHPQDAGGGWTRCNDDTAAPIRHRASRGECSTELAPAPQPGLTPPPPDECSSDSDCAYLAYGHCQRDWAFGRAVCKSGCVRDSECAPSEVCLCEEPVGRCVTADCAIDADCQAGFLCATYTPTSSCAPIPVSGVACQRTSDECALASDCEPGLAGPLCGKNDPDSERSCGQVQGGCGG